MCGILGVVHFDRRPIDPGLVADMTDTLTHRGPDGQGYVFADTCHQRVVEVVGEADPVAGIESIRPNAALGHRRLSILDLETGHQPMSNEDDKVWITFNGEIYNFIELRDTLIQRGHRFKTHHSDTEVIIHAYEEWGDACVARLRGMFAFGILDLNRRRIFLARDRLGIKPLVYYQDDDRFIFASEIKAIVADRNVPRLLDMASVNAYLTFQYVPTPKTIFKQIKKLPPATTFSLSLDGRETHGPEAYWNLVFEPDRTVDEAAWCDRLLEVLGGSVEKRLVSDVPLGVFLSGGIDSSAVVALMSRASDRPVKTFSIGFEEADFTEVEYARIVAQRFGTDHQEFVIRPDAVEILPRLVWQFDEPFGDFSAVPTFYVSQLARQYVTVCLSGDGGDEVFAGYDRYASMVRYARTDRIPPSVKKLTFGTLHRLFPERFKGKGVLERLSLCAGDTYYAMMSIFRLHERLQILTGDAISEIEPEGPADMFREIYQAQDADYLSCLQYVDLRTYLLDDILTKVDRTSMMNSLECRVPFLDHEVLELAAKIPSNLKLRGAAQKYILKRALGDLLPGEILGREKMGFGVPVSRWFRGGWNDYMQDVLLDSTTEHRGIFNRSYLDFLVRTHCSGTRDFGHRIWCLLFFELWCRQWLE